MTLCTNAFVPHNYHIAIRSSPLAQESKAIPKARQEVVRWSIADCYVPMVERLYHENKEEGLWKQR